MAIPRGFPHPRMKYLETITPRPWSPKPWPPRRKDLLQFRLLGCFPQEFNDLTLLLLDNSGRDLELAQIFAQRSPGLIPVADGIGIFLLRITQLDPVKFSNDVPVKMRHLPLFLFHLEPSMVLENCLGCSAELAACLREALHGFVCLVHMLPGGYLAGDAEVVATGA